MVANAHETGQVVIVINVRSGATLDDVRQGFERELTGIPHTLADAVSGPVPSSEVAQLLIDYHSALQTMPRAAAAEAAIAIMSAKLAASRLRPAPFHATDLVVAN